MEGGRQCSDVVEQAGPDWSTLPLDILRTIAGLIDGLEDYIHFGAVCTSWKSATFSSYSDCPKSSKRRLEYPWLMLVQNDSEGEKRGFYSLHSGKEFYLDLPESHDKTCFGSPCGWLVTIDTDLKMHLLNPLTRKHLPLPLLTTTDEYQHTKHARAAFVQKALVVWDGDTPIVFVIHWCRKLAMARPGDSSWTPVVPPCGSEIESMDLFKGEVLVLTADKIHTVDLSSLSPPRLNEFRAPCPRRQYNELVYLVDIGGDLHALFAFPKRSPCNKHFVKDQFLVFKFDMVERRWEEVYTLSGWTAFVGCNSSFALPSTDYPLCRPNCIYFTDDFLQYCPTSGGSDWGIFSVEPWSDEESGEESEEESEEQTREESEEQTREESEEQSGEESEEQSGEESEEQTREESEEQSGEESEEQSGEESEEQSGEESEEQSGEEREEQSGQGTWDDLHVMSRRPFSLSSAQFSTFCPPLWIAPNLW